MAGSTRTAPRSGTRARTSEITRLRGRNSGPWRSSLTVVAANTAAAATAAVAAAARAHLRRCPNAAKTGPGRARVATDHASVSHAHIPAGFVHRIVYESVPERP